MKKITSMRYCSLCLCFILTLLFFTNLSAQVISMGANGSGGVTMYACPDGTVQIWGNNGLGQEGTNCATSSGNGFTTVLAGADASCSTNLCNITSVAEGSNYDSYALDSKGHVWGWGYNNFSNLAQGVDGCDAGTCGVYCNEPVPVEILTAWASPLRGITQIAAGFNTGLAVDSTGNLWSWGYNNFCQVGNDVCGTDVSYAVKVHGVSNVGTLSGVTACAAGYANALAVANGNVFGWGLNNCGQCGQGYPNNEAVPVEVETSTSGPVYLTHCKAVAIGQYNAYELDSSGHVWTWGLDNLGQGGVNLVDNAPGDGGGSSNNTAVEVGSNGCGGGMLHGIIAIAAGWSNAYALDSSGNVWAWGYNNNGECGIGNTTEQNCPVEVETAVSTPLTNIVAISAGTWEAMALSSSGTIYTWGYNSGGMLGNTAYSVNSTGPMYATPMTSGYCTISTSVSSLSNAQNDITVFPNPNKGIFMIIGLEPSMIIEVYDITGKNILGTVASDNTINLNLTGIPNGTYLIKILTKEGNMVSNKKVSVER